MSERYKVINSQTPTFITITINGWVDLFVRPVYSNIIDDAINYCIKNKGLIVHAYIYMTSHLHLIVSSKEVELPAIIRDFKKHTSKELIKAIKNINESRREWMLKKFAYEANRSGRTSHYKLWQDGFHPVILDTNEKIVQRVNYIHKNPVKAGIVRQERDYLNSSYLAYENKDFKMLNIPVHVLF
ncbi:transposase [Putridiphycobacter roseus]|uniref:Transposase n=1 Tax=Putridiphycobacter roseus TaxID=2219161 RepID=A0A2W1NMT5_9FLAO|nr:transposase [Putridiphycobacter roseus]PZE16982.1 transposase [Putridiphycobacter roseus]